MRPVPRRDGPAPSNLDRTRRVVRPWVVLLAAGEGRGFGDFSIRMSGRNIPKQFWSLGSQGGMLDWAMARAARIAPPERVLAISRIDHGRWTRAPFRNLPPDRIVLQPSDRGTAPGVLLALMLLGRLDPNAVVVLLPCDHHVEAEGLLTEAIGAATRLASRREVILALGARAGLSGPGGPWLVPQELASTGITVARRSALIGLFAATVPDLVADCVTWATDWISGRGSLRPLYETIPPRDFNRQVLYKAPTALAVAEIPHCGFADLGTPAKFARFLRSQSTPSSPVHARRHETTGARASA